MRVNVDKRMSEVDVNNNWDWPENLNRYEKEINSFDEFKRQINKANIYVGVHIPNDVISVKITGKEAVRLYERLCGEFKITVFAWTYSDGYRNVSIYFDDFDQKENDCES